MARTRERPTGTRRPAPRPKQVDRSAEFQDPHHPAAPAGKGLELALGREVRNFRRKLDMTVAELTKQSGLSAGMLSKIKNGQTSPSLGTLQALSVALHVPVTAFFRRFEEERNATYVKAGQGLKIERRGTRAGHQYHLLGHAMRKNLVVEPYLIELLAHSDVFPLFQHDGVEFLYNTESKIATVPFKGHMSNLQNVRDGLRAWAMTRGYETTERPYEIWKSGIDSGFTGQEGEYDVIWAIK